jgi:hypothetical protein
MGQRRVPDLLVENDPVITDLQRANRRRWMVTLVLQSVSRGRRA